MIIAEAHKVEQSAEAESQRVVFQNLDEKLIFSVTWESYLATVYNNEAKLGLTLYPTSIRYKN